MIQVLCKKRFRFKNPNLDMIKNTTVGTGDDKQVVQVESGAKFEDVYFEVTPNKLTAAPDWIRTDIMFKWGVADGDILEVVTKNPSQAEAEQQQADTERAQDAEKKSAEVEEARKQLSSMTKVKLLQYASDKFELELSNSLSKEDIITAIEQAEKDSAEEGA